eukprot:305977_1
MHITKVSSRNSLCGLLGLPSIKPKPREDFIIRHRKRNNANDLYLNQHSLDQRRVVFIGLSGPYHSWTQCPSVTLYSALFIVPLKSAWVLDPRKHRKELQSAFPAGTTHREMRAFVDLLLWKHSQGFVFWMLDGHRMPEQWKQNRNRDPLIDPFWYCLSDALSVLCDPISGATHNPLILDSKWYQQDFVTKFDTNAVNILSELYFVTQKENVIKEIVYQSNPKSMFPVCSYHNNAMYSLYTIHE